MQVSFNSTQSVCHRCWQRVDHNVLNPVQNPVEHEPEVPPPVPVPPLQNDVQGSNDGELYVPSYKRAPNTSSHCIFGACGNDNRRRIPKTIKLYMMTTHQLYIPQHARVCREHLESNMWDELENHCTISHYFTAEHFTDVCNIFTEGIISNKQYDFETMVGLNDDSLHFWVGLNGSEFRSIILQTPSLRAYSDNRTILGLYLAKLRTGESNERLANLFKMSRRTLERKLAIARQCLIDEYVPQHLGIDHITREDALQRNLAIPKYLFGNHENTKLIVICDGTYVYIQKSSNFLFQRLSYSLHKFSNLLKPFIITTSDGYMIDILGPYAATTSDATILNSILENEEHPLHVFLVPNDVFILDRGFRDAIENLGMYDYEGHIPPTKDRSATQLTTTQANKSRQVTICRWEIEVVNGRFKRDYKLLRQEYFNKALLHMFDDFKVCGALINHFHPVISDSERSPAIINRIQERIHTPNILQEYVERKHLNRQRISFVRIEENQIEDFPHLTEEEIILFALGTYQLKLARSYCSEHLRNGVYIIEVYRDEQLEDLTDFNIFQTNVFLIRIHIQSRHARAREYRSYILIDRDQTGISSILQYYCTCLTGSRTLGSCAHILSVVWYMGLARYEGFNPPAAFLDSIILDID